MNYHFHEASGEGRSRRAGPVSVLILCVVVVVLMSGGVAAGV